MEISSIELEQINPLDFPLLDIVSISQIKIFFTNKVNGTFALVDKVYISKLYLININQII
jgi:hypothetical protein